MSKASEKRWEYNNLTQLVRDSVSVRQVLKALGLKEAGGNYKQFERYKIKYNLDTSHFAGQSANKGRKIPREPVRPLAEMLRADIHLGLRNLKKRLFQEGLKFPSCEECGWAEVSEDGRRPVELDHINGNNRDNRIENLRILCPNCHSLKPTHRGSNIVLRRRGGEIGIHATLKTL